MPLQVQQVIIKLQYLSPERLAEVDDFIDFLQKRDQEKALNQDFAAAANAAFQKIWDNEDDAIYDNL